MLSESKIGSYVLPKRFLIRVALRARGSNHNFSSRAACSEYLVLLPITLSFVRKICSTSRRRLLARHPHHPPLQPDTALRPRRFSDGEQTRRRGEILCKGRTDLFTTASRSASTYSVRGRPSEPLLRHCGFLNVPHRLAHTRDFLHVALLAASCICTGT